MSEGPIHNVPLDFWLNQPSGLAIPIMWVAPVAVKINVDMSFFQETFEMKMQRRKTYRQYNEFDIKEIEDDILNEFEIIVPNMFIFNNDPLLKKVYKYLYLLTNG